MFSKFYKSFLKSRQAPEISQVLIVYGYSFCNILLLVCFNVRFHLFFYFFYNFISAGCFKSCSFVFLILFVTSVGYIAGPKFFGNFKKNFKSYVLLGLVIILVGGLSAVGCILAGDAIGYGSSIETRDGFVAMIVGLLSGSLTSTPAFSAAKATVAEQYTGLVSVGHGIAYIFGVVGSDYP